MIIFNAEQIRGWDAYAIAKEPISSIDLMERACAAFVTWFVPKFGIEKSIDVVCGTGNNGGDGLGIARLLSDRGYRVRVCIIPSSRQTDDFKINRGRLPKQIEVLEISDAESFEVRAHIVIDAIFGSGLTRPVEGIYGNVIAAINNEPEITRIAVDVPSGLLLDEPSSGHIVQAHHTVTFQSPKLPFMFPEYGDCVGEFTIVDIGLPEDYAAVKRVPFGNIFLDESFKQSMPAPRDKFSHKGNHGHALLVAGSLGKMGAAVLAAKAILRSGAGLTTVHVPKCGYDIIQTAVPEAMASVDGGQDYTTDLGDISRYDAIGIGPGLGNILPTIAAVRQAIESGKPLILDADALNILSTNRDLLKRLPMGSILTPHPGEFRRLVGAWSDDFQRLELQRKFAEATKCVVVLKGAHTSIAAPYGGIVWFNSTGNPGMAKGGSGDVLTGILTALLARGYSSDMAAMIGVYAHGLAGDLAAAKVGQNALLAGDIVEFLGQSFRR